jgi:hypothetical protein
VRTDINIYEKAVMELIIDCNGSLRRHADISPVVTAQNHGILFLLQFLRVYECSGIYLYNIEPGRKTKKYKKEIKIESSMRKQVGLDGLVQGWGTRGLKATCGLLGP